ncbi:hypothetical protein LXL04_035779 [Taraxacum kok-saghyz]
MATTTGVIATVDSDRPPPLPLDSIPIIDLSLLSQSELFSLSMCSNSSFDLNRCDDVVIPKIDRSVFNESAGSRKQTYSRLRLAPAESPTSTKTTIHRRTPRLRSSHTPAPNNITGAEQAENSKIICMLKELFKSDHNFQDLVPVEVETDSNVVVPELLTLETTRKRGRPRKHENDVFIHPPAAKRICNNTVKKVVAYDADRDTELVNSSGVEVDLKNLGMLEDPFGVEIRRKTEGMSTKDELLGFLGGLDGEWGTSRKKKRVVDASIFGEALPKGWKLSLSIKKKLGRVWLFCRRYISPSGRQFDSCKEVSMYLLSLVGEQNLDKHTHAQSNTSGDFSPKGPSVIVNADVCVQESITQKRPVVLALFSSLTDFKKQVKSNIVDPIDVQIKEAFKCLKCFMIFEGKVDLLDHQVLAHKTETSQLDSKISEWMVVKGGTFECHFCNETFNESGKYNEHIGTHDTSDKNTSEAPTAEKTVVIESHDAAFGDKHVSSSSSSASSESDTKINCESNEHVHVHDLNNLTQDHQGEPVSMNEDVLVEKSVDEIETKCDVDDKKTSEASKTLIAEKTVVMESHDADFDDKIVSSSSQSDDKISHGTESEINEQVHVHVHDLNILADDNQGEPVNMNEDILLEESEKKHNVDIEFPKIDQDPMSIDENNRNLESKAVTADCVDDKCNQGSDGITNGQDEVSETRVTHVDDKMECILENEKTSENIPLLQSTNDSLEKTVLGSDEVPNLPDSETICEKKAFWENINHSSFDDLASEKDKMVEKEKVAFSEFEENKFSYEINEHEIRTIETYKEHDVSNLEEPQTQMNMEDLNRSIDVNLDDFHLFTNDEPVNTDNNNNPNFNPEKNLEFSSLVPPVIQQDFTFQDHDDVACLYNTNGGHQRGFLDHFSIPETYDDIFDENRGINIHELNLAFNEEKKDGSKIDDSFDVQTDLSMVNNNNTRDYSHNVGTTWEHDFSLNGLRPVGRSEPMEFRFLSGRSEGGSSQVVYNQYNNNNNNSNMEEGFGSGYWNGKSGNENGGNVITRICGWCRNQFHVVVNEAQQGGALCCPSCSAGMSGQVNML